MQNGGRGNEHIQMTRSLPLPPPEQRPKLRGPSNAHGAGQCERACRLFLRPQLTVHSQKRTARQLRPALRYASRLLFRKLHAETFAPAAPPRIDHRAAAPGSHAGTEPVLVDAFAIAGAICRLHQDLWAYGAAAAAEDSAKTTNIELSAARVNRGAAMVLDFSTAAPYVAPRLSRARARATSSWS